MIALGSPSYGQAEAQQQAEMLNKIKAGGNLRWCSSN